MNKATSGKILECLKLKQDDMVQLLTRCAMLESPSAIPASQDAVFDLLSSELSAIGFRCRRLKGIKTGGQLVAVPSEFDKKMPRQLLLGHCDTVWPEGTLHKMPVESREGRLHGPGVYDMKGGLVQAIFAIAALREIGMEPEVSPVLFINSDEEIGSPESAERIEKLARVVDRTLVMEPSLGGKGLLKTSRKGVGRFVIRVVGRAAHAGLDPEKGISAILELTHVVQALFALNDPQQGITVNVGTIDGGLRPNVVAPESRAEVDVRVRTRDDATRIEHAIRSIGPTVPGTELEITGRFGRPPLESTPGNKRLWHRAVDAAEMLGIEISEGAAGGGSDGNWTSLYAPTLDGLGSVGDGAHALTEHVVEAKMPERAALLACLLMGEPISNPTDNGQSQAWIEVEDAMNQEIF